MKKKKFWKSCPFKEGEKFKVTENIAQQKTSFHQGEELFFIRTEVGYASITRFLFKDKQGENKIFEMPESKGVEELKRIFIKIETPLLVKPKKKITLLEIAIVVAIIGVILRFVLMVPSLKESLFEHPVLSGLGVLGAILFFYLKKILKF